MNVNFKINLLVLKFSDIDQSALFYRKVFDIDFEKHSHGSGPIHYSTTMDINGIVFEIYPVAPIEVGISHLARIGFEVASISDILKKMENYSHLIISQPKDSQWGLRAVISDPDGHRIELTEKLHEKDPNCNPSRVNV